jgi:hypothetical protein
MATAYTPSPDGNIYNPIDPQSLDTCWIQPGMYPNLVKWGADSTYAPYLNNAILMACAQINRMCNRKFNRQTMDQIFPDTGLVLRQYRSFVVDNVPIYQVDKAWLQVVNTFAEIDDTYFQVDEVSGLIKILPTFSTYVQTTLPMYALMPSTNLWIRYTAGYLVDYSDSNTDNEVPEPVKLATSLYVDYYFSRFNLTGGVAEFKTQTYSQKNITSKKQDPILVAIEDLIEPYKLYNVR